jgi:hypothetical protein
MAGARLSRRLILAGAIAPVAACMLAPVAAAHPMKTVLTTVEWNARNSAIEVVHRLHPHDAEIALSGGGSGAFDLGDIKQQARLLLYLQSRFVLTSRGRALVLEPVGVETGEAETMAYLEGRISAPPSELLVDDRIFRDIFDDQTNLVNIRMGKGVRTLMFAGRDGAKSARNLT